MLRLIRDQMIISVSLSIFPTDCSASLLLICKIALKSMHSVDQKPTRMSLLVFTIFHIFILVNIPFSWSLSTNFQTIENSEILSRHRRFFLPDVNNTWTFKARFSLVVPLIGLDTSFDGNVPFSFNYNAQRYSMVLDNRVALNDCVIGRNNMFKSRM